MFIHCKSNFTPQYPCSFYDEGNFFLLLFLFFFLKKAPSFWNFLSYNRFSFTIKSHISTQLEPLPSLYFLCLVALLIVIKLIRKVVAQNELLYY